MKIEAPTALTRLPDAILFDTDNTLYAYDPCHVRAMEAVANKAESELGISRRDFGKTLDLARSQVKADLAGTAASHSRLLYMQRSVELLGLGSQLLLALDLEQTYWRTFLNEAKLFEGVVPLLDQIRRMGIPVAIVTDLTAQIQFRKVIYFGLDQYFDAVVTSEESGADKPDPRSFRLALTKLRPAGDVVWMIGDNPEADIRGARQAIGATTLQKVHPGVVRGEGDCRPDAYFSSFDEVRSLLDDLSHRKETGDGSP